MLQQLRDVDPPSQ